MQKKLTITIDEKVYDGLYRVVGPGKISQFIEKLIRPHVMESDLEASYAKMARDDARESEASEWTEGLIGDIDSEMREVNRIIKTQLGLH